MIVFESLNETTNKATDSAEKYLNTSKDYIKLKTFQQLTISLSLVTKFVLIGGIAGLSMIFLAIAAAIAIGESLHSLPLGYVSVGLIFLIIALFVYYFRAKIDKTIIGTLASKFFD